MIKLEQKYFVRFPERGFGPVELIPILENQQTNWPKPELTSSVLKIEFDIRQGSIRSGSTSHDYETWKKQQIEFFDRPVTLRFILDDAFVLKIESDDLPINLIGQLYMEFIFSKGFDSPFEMKLI